MGNLSGRDDEAVEIIVIMFSLGAMAGPAVLDVILGPDSEPKEERMIDLAATGGEHFDAARQRVRDRRTRSGEPVFIQQITLVQHDEIGASDLILEHLFDWIIVHQRAVGGALALERIEVGRDAAIGKRDTIDDHYDAVDSDAGFDRRPMKCLHELLPQSEAGSLDHNMIDDVLGENSDDLGHELLTQHTAHADIVVYD